MLNVGLRAKLYIYKMLDDSEDKNVRVIKECYKKEYSISRVLVLKEGTTSKNECYAK